MPTSHLPRAWVAVLLCLMVLGCARPSAGSDPGPKLADLAAKLPLSFEINRGQAPAAVKFLSRGHGYGLYLSSTDAVLVLAAPRADKPRLLDSPLNPPLDVQDDLVRHPPATLTIRLLGSDSTEMASLDELPGKRNYLVGNDSRQWRTNIPTYARVRYREIYPGVDLLFYGNQQQLEYDFVLSPGADPARIRLGIDGAEKIESDAAGNLLLHIPGGVVGFHKPMIYQEANGTHEPIRGGYVLLAGNQVGFQVDGYDRGKPLVIDPVLYYSTYLGVGGEVAEAIAVESLGDAYITGEAPSLAFPGATGSGDMFVAKLNSAGTALFYSTLLGGTTGTEVPIGIAVDGFSQAHVTGITADPNFFTTSGAFQRTMSNTSQQTGFVFALNPTGTGFIYSTFLGGPFSADLAARIVADSAGNAYVTGETASPYFPTKNALQSFAGGGAFRSTNNGKAWSTINTGLTNLNVTVLAVDPVTPTTVYAGTTSGVYKSINSGTAWAPSSTGMPTNASVYFVAVDPRTPANVYALFNIPFVSPPNLFKSADHGSTWAPVTVPPNRPVRLLAVDPVTPTNLYVVAGGGPIFKSTDGGSSWSQLLPGLTPPQIIGITSWAALLVNPVTPTTLYLGTNGNGVFKSTDGGSNWTQVVTGLPGMNVQALAIDPSATHLYAATSSPGSPSGAGIFVSTDGGNIWNAINTGLPTTDLFVFCLVVDPNSPSTLYAGTRSSGVYKSKNRGGTWTASHSGMGTVRIRSLAIDPVFSNLLAGSIILDAFVTKFDPLGRLVYSSYLGGGSADGGLAIAVDDSGNAYIAGSTNSVNFPTVNAAQPTYGGGGADAFVAKINPAGKKLLYSTYLGGGGQEATGFAQTMGIAVDASGRAYVAGETSSTDFPIVKGFQRTFGGGAWDAFLTKLNASGQFAYSTYLGGHGTEWVNGVAVDSFGNIYVAGLTDSSDFLLVNPLQLFPAVPATVAFVSQFNPNGSQVQFSTVLGGSTGDGGNPPETEPWAGIAVDAASSVYIAGYTNTTDFPTAYPYQGSLIGSPYNAFVAKIAHVLKAQAQTGVSSDGSKTSAFAAAQGSAPVIFTLTVDDAPTCQLPPATISVFRTTGNATAPIISGSSFTIAGCQYEYNLNPASLGPGTYLVHINIYKETVGSTEVTLH